MIDMQLEFDHVAKLQRFLFMTTDSIAEFSRTGLELVSILKQRDRAGLSKLLPTDTTTTEQAFANISAENLIESLGEIQAIFQKFGVAGLNHVANTLGDIGKLKKAFLPLLLATVGLAPHSAKLFGTLMTASGHVSRRYLAVEVHSNCSKK